MCDSRLIRIALENLTQNAWKYTSKRDQARIHFGLHTDSPVPTYVFTDNGAGFDSSYAIKLFTPFQRLHSNEEFEGTGVGLAIVKRIISRHGGTIWADGQVNAGASFYFTLVPIN
jgi:light-regulated signal transduction histidine kinase (bacteriophytochrome)